jgi:hypothetical protein
LKLVVSLLLIINFIYAKGVVIAIKNINFNESVTVDDVIEVEYDKHVRCSGISINQLKQNHYIAKHYLIKGRPICQKDIQIAKEQIVKFDFGNIIIEKKGKIISKGKDYIKIKKPNGKIEKIYTNGKF